MGAVEQGCERSCAGKNSRLGRPQLGTFKAQSVSRPFKQRSMSLLRRLHFGRTIWTTTTIRWSSTTTGGRPRGGDRGADDAGDTNPMQADKVKVEAAGLNFPSAEPYLHLRTGRRNLICTNEQEVEEARKNLPSLFKTRRTDIGELRAPKYRARTRKALRNRVLAAGREWSWDVPRKNMIRIMPFKGHKRWHKIEEKFQDIQKRMSEMPAKIAIYRAERSKNISLRYQAKKKGSEGILDKIMRSRGKK
eukprot:Plantae.Rhodophyta-Purpureofilum_apyrenoidigerum.ctg18392.p1 GENE.Plantae.Rhodophyta-Purpureofilum_apyrenoidigerum.ctg18392~~Plantae.Rhodophyta-Purpureofilum_apyrenoidigerum.ctg18392.p1  ORF type:complete len:248 (-),score=29.09 Plantae.Rhodophyta-Purpureofilum_apyrenoidigerum.ctg18392:246-989(-)